MLLRKANRPIGLITIITQFLEQHLISVNSKQSLSDRDQIFQFLELKHRGSRVTPTDIKGPFSPEFAIILLSLLPEFRAKL